MTNENTRAFALGSGGEGLGCLNGVRLRAQWRVRESVKLGADFRFDAPDLVYGKQLDLVSEGPEVVYSVSGVVVLLVRLDSRERAALPELDVIAHFQLEMLEDLKAPHGQVSFEVREIAPAQRTDAAHVDAGSLACNLASLQQRDAPSGFRKMEGRGGAGDAATYYEDLSFGQCSNPHPSLPPLKRGEAIVARPPF